MVHGREKEGKAEEFGVSGYVHKDVFLMYDRSTKSLWYPFEHDKWTAVSGPRRGEVIPILDLPAPVSLGNWRKQHPETKVLLGSKEIIENGGRRRRRR